MPNYCQSSVQNLKPKAFLDTRIISWLFQLHQLNSNHHGLQSRQVITTFATKLNTSRTFSIILSIQASKGEEILTEDVRLIFHVHISRDITDY